MPIYDYKCENCNLIKEVRKKITDDSLEFCEKCNVKMNKIISKSSFVLADGDVGWYKDGYSSKKESK